MSKESTANFLNSKKEAAILKSSSICSICSAEAVSKCQRCLSIVYCSKECQQRGWTGLNSHRKICSQVKKAKEKVEIETEKLISFKNKRNEDNNKTDSSEYESINLFDTHAGKLWEFKEAHSYCESRLELALALRECGAKNNSLIAIEFAVDHLLSLLGLMGGDQMNAIVKTVPGLLLLLRKENEAYNFIKWFEDIGCETEIDWLKIDFLDLKAEDITETLPWTELETQTIVEITMAKVLAKYRLEKEIGFGITLKDMEKQLQELFWIIKDKNELLWKFICDPIGMEELCQKEMETDPMSFIEPKGDLKEALEIKRNTALIWKKDPEVRRSVSKHLGSKSTLQELSQNAEWAIHVGNRKHAFLIDCYRLRLDDDYVWGGCNLHGLYADGSPLSITEDFIIFCTLAARAGMIPLLWDWKLFLQEAVTKIKFAYEKSDAQEDWGMLGPMMLRTTADSVYGGGPDNADDAMIEKIQSDIDSHRETIFREIGGMKNWNALVDELEQNYYDSGESVSSDYFNSGGSTSSDDGYFY